MAIKNPLSDQDRKDMNKTLAGLIEHEKAIQMALEAGLDECTPLMERNGECQSRIKNIKKVYFPNKP